MLYGLVLYRGMEHVEQPEAGPSTAPRLRIKSESDVAAWQASAGYQSFVSWLFLRASRLKGRHILTGPSSIENVQHIVNTLDIMTTWVEEAPPHAASQRFGNLAFRDYHRMVKERLPAHLSKIPHLEPHLHRILPLLLDSHAFGHPTRLDYGSGHELSFILALWVLKVQKWLPEDEEVEDELVLRVLPKYLELVTLLQHTYRLEPAGSHGVWGLDDYCFLPYLFGAAQLIDTDTTPAQALENARNPKHVPTDLWTLSLRRVFEFKTGPFMEHSPLLFELSSFPAFTKPYTGLLKMYQAEVLAKRVVVQHIHLDDITWGEGVENYPQEGDQAQTPMTREWEGTRMPRMMSRQAEVGMPTRLPSKVGLPRGETTLAPWAR